MVEHDGGFEVASGVSGIWELLRMVSGLIVVLAALGVAVWAVLIGDTLAAQPSRSLEAEQPPGAVVEVATHRAPSGTAPPLPIEVVYYVVDSPEQAEVVRRVLQIGAVSPPQSAEIITLSSPGSLIALNDLMAWGVHEAASQGGLVMVIDLRQAEGH